MHFHWGLAYWDQRVAFSCVFSFYFSGIILFFFFASLRGEKSEDLEVRKKASWHVGETLTISDGTEQTASTDHCTLVSVWLQPSQLQPVYTFITLLWPVHMQLSAPGENKAVRLASLEDIFPWESPFALQPMSSAALIVQVWTAVYLHFIFFLEKIKCFYAHITTIKQSFLRHHHLLRHLRLFSMLSFLPSEFASLTSSSAVHKTVVRMSGKTAVRSVWRAYLRRRRGLHLLLTLLLGEPCCFFVLSKLLRKLDREGNKQWGL